MMTENNTTNNPTEADLNQMDHQTEQRVSQPQKKKGKWRPALIWLIPFIALLIGLSLAIKSILAIGPTIYVSFRTAEGLVAGKTTVKYRQVDIDWFVKLYCRMIAHTLLPKSNSAKMPVILQRKMRDFGWCALE